MNGNFSVLWAAADDCFNHFWLFFRFSFSFSPQYVTHHWKITTSQYPLEHLQTACFVWQAEKYSVYREKQQMFGIFLHKDVTMNLLSKLLSSFLFCFVNRHLNSAPDNEIILNCFVFKISRFTVARNLVHLKLQWMQFNTLALQ